ncbi:MAG: N-methyl-D-aspartate receptor NMDAR2C subunit [Candidatus Omnitrophica bacterium]|nr:N-methyl-D-aspartate receptor NMDAR2C subunit [Candidatus Omnitrophota bacterium]
MRDKNTGNRATLVRWLGLWGGNTRREALKAVFHDLEKRYHEPHRHYHTLRHLSRCLEELDGARSQADSPFEIELALWFHDAVYDPRRSDNEEASAGLAEESLNGFIDGESLSRVTALILATRHAGPPDTSDERLAADADLAILGSPPDEYREYEEAIRQEYSWAPEDGYRAGRARLLSRLLARPQIYYTGHFRQRYEERARANLSRSISLLRGQG